MLAVVVVIALGVNAFRSPLAGVLTGQLGHEVTIDGLMTLGWSDGPALVLRDVSVAGDQDTSPGLEAGKIYLGMQGKALFRGDLVVAHAALSDVVLRTYLFGGATAGEAGEEDEGAVDLSFLNSDTTFDLANLTVFTQPVNDNPIQIQVSSLGMRFVDGEDLRADAVLKVGDGRIEVELEGGSLAELLSGTDWPLKADLSDGATSVQIVGTVHDAIRAPRAEFDLQANSKAVGPTQGLFGLERNFESVLAASAKIQANIQGLVASEIEVSFDELEVSGTLALDLVSDPLRLSGALSINELPKTQTNSDGGVNLANLLDTPVPYDLFSELDLDLVVELDRHELGAVVLDGLSLPLNLSQGTLTASPIVLSIDGEEIEAEFTAEAATGKASLRLSAAVIPLTELFERVRPDLAVTGQVSGVKLDASAQGMIVRDILATLELDLTGTGLELSNVFSDGKQLHVVLDSFGGSIGADKGLEFVADGTVDDEEASILLASGSLADLVGGVDQWPIEAHLGRSDRGIELAGVVFNLDEAVKWRIEALLCARDIQAVAELVAINLPLEGSVEAYVHTSQLDDGLRFDWIDMSVGASQANGSLDVTFESDDVHITGDLTAPTLEIKTGDGDDDIDALFLESGALNGVEANIGITIDRLHADPIRFSEVKTTGVITNDVLTLDPFDSRVFGAPAILTLVVDTSGAAPVIAVTGKATDVDPDDIGNNLGMQGLMTGQIGTMTVSGTTTGTTFREMASSAELAFGAADATLQIGDDQTSLDIHDIQLSAKPGERATGTESVVLAGVPIKLELTFVSLLDLIEKPSPWILDGTASLLGLDLEIEREVTPSMEVYARPVTMKATSDDFREALETFDLDLPTVLPFDADGTVQVFADRVVFALDSALLARSDASGTVVFWLDETPRRVEADFTSKLLVLDDFFSEEETQDDQEFDLETLLNRPLPAWDLPPVHLNIQLESDDLHWDNVVVQKIGTKIETRDGAVHFEGLSAHAFGGGLTGAFMFAPNGPQTRFKGNFDINDIESNAVVQFAGLADGAAGVIDLEADIDVTGATVSEMLASLDGELKIERGAGWIKSVAVQLLTKNLFAGLLSSIFDSADQTNVRCVIVDAEFDNGQGAFRRSGIALENVLILLSGSIDLDALSIDARLDPQSLDTSFLRLLVPVTVEGSLLDPKVSPVRGGVLTGVGEALLGAGPTFDVDVDVDVDARCDEIDEP